MEIKSKTLFPGTFEFYTKVIQTHLIPLYGKFELEEFRVRHVQGYIQYLSNLKRMDRKQDDLTPSTVKRIRYCVALYPFPRLQTGIY